MDPPDRRGDHRLRGPRAGDPRLARPSRSPDAPCGDDRGRASRRVPGVARPGDRSPEQLRRVRDGPPRGRDGAGRRCSSGSSLRSLYPARLSGGGSQRFTLLAAFAARRVFALLLFGSHVTATSQWFVFPDWPLMDGSLFPASTDANSAHVLHRWIAVVVGLIVAAVFVAALASAAPEPLDRPAGGPRRGAVPDPGGHRRPPDPDDAVGLDADAPSRARRVHLGAGSSPWSRLVPRGSVGGARAGRRERRPAQRATGPATRPATRPPRPGPARTRFAPTSP